MPALTRDTPRLRVGEIKGKKRLPVATATTIYAGSLVMVNAGGFAVTGAAATGQFAAGVAAQGVVNSGANGALFVEVDEGDFEFASGTAGDALTVANYGDQVFIIDDDTVGATNGGATRSAAGTCIGLTINGRPLVRIGA
jgi:hypothetical protein